MYLHAHICIQKARSRILCSRTAVTPVTRKGLPSKLA